MSITSLAHFAVAAHVGDWDAAVSAAAKLPPLPAAEIAVQPLIENALLLSLTEGPPELLDILRCRVIGLSRLPSTIVIEPWIDDVLRTLAAIHGKLACSALAVSDEMTAESHLLRLIALPTRDPKVEGAIVHLVDILMSIVAHLEAALPASVLGETSLLFMPQQAEKLLQEAFGAEFDGFRLLSTTLRACTDSDAYRDHIRLRVCTLLCTAAWPTLRQLSWLFTELPDTLEDASDLPLGPAGRAFLWAE